MVSYRSDDPRVERHLRLMRGLVEGAGGILRQEVELRCEAGELSVACAAALEPRSMLTAIPESCMLPVDTVGLGVAGDAVSMDADSAGLSPLQRRLFESMLEIYALTDKLPRHRSASVWCALAGEPEILRDVVAGRADSAFVQRFLGHAAAGEHATLVLESFLKTRVFYAGQGGWRRRVLVPINDFIDHHAFAPGFSRTGSADDPRATVLAWRQAADDDACFVSYTQMDAYDSLLLYSFVHDAAPVVRSVPLELHLKGLGRLRVGARMGQAPGGPLPPEAAGLRAYLPETLAPSPGELELSHLFIPIGLRPHALYRVLEMTIASMAGRPSEPTLTGYVREAERQVLAINVAFYEQLERRLLARRTAAGAPGVLDTVVAMARLQARKLAAYRFG
jgi:hypothetical protein